MTRRYWKIFLRSLLALGGLGALGVIVYSFALQKELKEERAGVTLPTATPEPRHGLFTDAELKEWLSNPKKETRKKFLRAFDYGQFVFDFFWAFEKLNDPESTTDLVDALLEQHREYVRS